MSTKAAKSETVSTKLISQWEAINEKLAVLADELPADKLSYKPAAQIRSCDEVLRHVAFWNHYVAERARGKPGDDSGNELPKQQFSSKKQILAALRTSTEAAAQALKEHSPGLSADSVEMLVSFIAHTAEHYGQLTVYARMNNIVPPVSRA